MKNKSDTVVRIESILKELPIPEKTVCFRWNDHTNEFDHAEKMRNILPADKAALVARIMSEIFQKSGIKKPSLILLIVVFLILALGGMSAAFFLILARNYT